MRPAFSMINNTRLDMTNSHKHLDLTLVAMLDALSGGTVWQSCQPRIFAKREQDKRDKKDPFFRHQVTLLGRVRLGHSKRALALRHVISFTFYIIQTILLLVPRKPVYILCNHFKLVSFIKNKIYQHISFSYK